MDAADVARRVFFEVHSDLPREAPGSRDSTARALACIESLPESPAVLDIGCGPGTQTLDLASLLPGARITAVDTHEPFVEVARRRMSDAGLGDRVRVERGDMRHLSCPDGSFDLIWCEGAAYVMGVREALTAWRPLLKAGGWIGFTEAVWLTQTRPDELTAWWMAQYPKMGSIDECLGHVAAAGYEAVGHFVLPESAWWVPYYTPMETRLERLRARYAAQPAALEVLAEHQREVDTYRRWSAHYGYVFVVARKTQES